jgi:aerobic carbon-monoxide dehydrogenase medium subunit
VKPPPFSYVRPETLPDVISCLASWGDEGKILAGGQSLIPLLNLRLARPAVLIDISGVESLTGIRAEDGAVVIRAATRQLQAERSAELRARCPLVGQALGHVAHAQIRARGTVGGSIAHADPASELPAVAAALDAEFIAQGPAGLRSIAAPDFFLGPYMTALNDDEVLCEIRLPATAGQRTSFLELARRRGDYALAGVAACLRLDGDGRVASAALAACGVGGVPVRLRAAEQAVTGRRPGAAALRDAAAAASGEVSPSADLHADEAYRRRLVGTLVTRVIEEAAR